MPVASGTRSLAWWDARPPSATRSTHRLCGRFIVRRVMTVRVDARGGTFAAVVASAAALCFHIHGLPPLTSSRVRIGPARPRCENRRALCSADDDSVHISPRRRRVTRDRDYQRRTHAGGPHPVFRYRCVPLRFVAPVRVLYDLCYRRSRWAPPPPPFFVPVFLRARVSARASEWACVQRYTKPRYRSPDETVYGFVTVYRARVARHRSTDRETYIENRSKIDVFPRYKTVVFCFFSLDRASPSASVRPVQSPQKPVRVPSSVVFSHRL